MLHFRFCLVAVMALILTGCPVLKMDSKDPQKGKLDFAALPVSLRTNEDTPLEASLASRGTDGKNFRFQILSEPHLGSVELLDDVSGEFRYQPEPDVSGSDSFVFIVTNGESEKHATVSIVIQPVNDAPVAGDAEVATAEDTAVTGSLSASDVDSSALTYSLVVNGSKGVVTILDAATGQFRYTPNPNANGSDTFTFKARDSALDSNTATVTVTINPVNDVPTVNPGAITVNEDTMYTGTLTATDVEGSALSFTLVDQAQKASVIITDSATGAFQYRPRTNQNGADSFTFKVSDGELESAVATITVTLNPIDDIPVGVNGTLSVDEDASGTGSFSATDIDSTAFSFSIASGGAHGSTQLIDETTGAFRYQSDANYNGPDVIKFIVTDGTSFSDIAEVAVTVRSVNDAPNAADMHLSTTQAAPIVSHLAGGDIDSDHLTYRILSNPQKGSISGFNASTGDFTYTPRPNQNGDDTLTYRVNDGALDSRIATVRFSLTYVNQPPVATAASFPVDEDSTYHGTLAGTDPDQDPLTFAIASQPQHGTLTLVNPSDGTFTYQPAGDYTGPDEFKFKANDGMVDSADATVTITVNAVNDAPIANNATLSTDEDTPKSMQLSASDLEGSALSWRIVSQGSKGQAFFESTTGMVRYTPSRDANGADSFTFQVNDGSRDSNVATVSVVIAPINDAPVASNAGLATPEDTELRATLSGNDVDGQSLTYSIVSPASQGTVTLLDPSTGAFRFVPNENVTGNATFQFKVNDGFLDSNIGTFTVMIQPVNDAPQAHDASMVTNEDTTLDGTLSASDVEGNSLTFSLVSEAGKGEVTLTDPATGAYQYAPNPDANGTDSFTFKANDGGANSNVATVTVTINPMQDPPRANEQSLVMDETAASLSLTLTGSDPDGDSLTFRVSTPPANGTLSGSGATLEYRPNPGFLGRDVFYFVANDGQSDSAVAPVGINVGGYTELCTLADLERIRQDRAGKFLLTCDIDGQGAEIWVLSGFDSDPATSWFSGTLDGRGNTIANVEVLNGNALFGVSTGTIRNLKLNAISPRFPHAFLAEQNRGLVENVTASGALWANNSASGLLVASNSGVIRRSFSSGAVTGYELIGGLVGHNSGIIEDSGSSATVSRSLPTNGYGNVAGGLVGSSTPGSRILRSYATGSVTGLAEIGGLVGRVEGVTITDCYATGAVTANGTFFYDKGSAGGLIGSMYRYGDLDRSYITRSYATGNVVGVDRAGGLIGLSRGATIQSAYATGSVTGTTQVGGLIGAVVEVVTDIDNVYATGAVTGATQVAGLIGGTYYDGYAGQTMALDHAYATGHVQGSSSVGGLFPDWTPGFPGPFVWQNAYWDRETTGIATGMLGTPLTTAQMKDKSSFPGFDFTRIWQQSDTPGVERPRLRMTEAPPPGPVDCNGLEDAVPYAAGTGSVADPYVICSAAQLQRFAVTPQHWGRAARLGKNIDMTGYTSANLPAIGSYNGSFTGVFDGAGYEIRNLTLHHPQAQDGAGIGMFYKVGAGAVIKNLGLRQVDIEGGAGVGALVAILENGATISRCYVEQGTVASVGPVGAATGGLVGRNEGQIQDSYARVTVNGRDKVGGLVGFHLGTMDRSYSTGSVQGNSNVGGLVGSNLSPYSGGANGQSTASFWDTSTSGQSNSGGGTGQSTADMQTQATFSGAGWNFTDVWAMPAGIGYPVLR